MTLFSMGTVVVCHKWLRKQGKLDVQINVSWLKGEKKHNQDSGADLVPKSDSSQNNHGDTQPVSRPGGASSHAGASLLAPSAQSSQSLESFNTPPSAPRVAVALAACPHSARKPAARFPSWLLRSVALPGPGQATVCDSRTSWRLHAVRSA